MGRNVAIISGKPALTDPLQATGEAEAIRSALEHAGNNVSVLTSDGGLTRALIQASPDACIFTTDTDVAARSLVDFLGLPAVGTPLDASDAVSDPHRLRDATAAVSLDMAERLCPPSMTITADAYRMLGGDDALEIVGSRMPAGFPVCVRSPHEHGVRDGRMVSSPTELIQAVDDALLLDDAAVIQEWVDGPQVAVPIVAGEYGPYTLPSALLRLIPSSYAGRAIETTVEYAGATWNVPVDLEALHEDRPLAESILSEIEREALDIFISVGCRDMGIVRAVWDGARARILDIDVRPSWGPSSLMAACAHVDGTDLSIILGELVDRAIERGIRL